MLRLFGSFLLIVLVGALISGCQTDSSVPEEKIPPGPEEILLGSTSLTIDENRQSIVLRNGVERYEHVRSVSVAIRDLDQVDQPVVWQGEAQRFNDAEGSYWVVYPEFTHPGLWMFDITATNENGEQVTQSVSDVVHPEPIGVTIGDPAPQSDSFVWGGDDQPDRITTDLTPNQAFYQITVAEAVTSAIPSVIMFATPELCTRNICSSVVDSLESLWERYGDRVNFVHVETYNLDTGRKVPAIGEWGLGLTPWIYLVDANGVIVARYDGMLGSEELAPAVEAMVTAS